MTEDTPCARGREIERVTRNGIVVDGREYQLDCLIFATGFDINSARTRRAGYDIVGRDNISLTSKWVDGMSSLHGMMTSGFPNLCFSPGINSQFAPLTINFPTSLTEFAQHMAHIIAHCVHNDVATFDVTPAAERDWVDTILARSARNDPYSRQRLELVQACIPGYFNNEGHPEEVPPEDSNFGGSAPEFYEMLERWREAGSFAGLDIRQRELRGTRASADPSTRTPDRSVHG